MVMPIFNRAKAMDRRTFTQHLLTVVSSYALLDSLFATQAFGRTIKPIASHWAIQLQEYCADLKTQTITPEQWQQQVEALFNRISLPDLLQFISFDNLVKGFNYPALGVNTKPVVFPKLSGLPERTVFVKKIFGMQKDRAIIPHGHSHMASAHLVLQGQMHLRHYDTIAQDKQHLIIKPTIDKIATAGSASSISDERDNVHWFIAQSNTAFTFDVIMLDLAEKPYDIYNLDIYAQQDLHNGTLRVPVLDVDTALKKYGRHHH